jgi:hydrogenase maturation protease
MMADWYRKRIVVLGCGNILFGDDGFGPAVAQYCQAHHGSPPDVCILDAGTSVRNVLFDILLSDRRPSRIVIVDAMDGGHEPGELFEPDVDSLPRVKIDDFSMHQLPTSNLLVSDIGYPGGGAPRPVRSGGTRGAARRRGTRHSPLRVGEHLGAGRRAGPQSWQQRAAALIDGAGCRL